MDVQPEVFMTRFDAPPNGLPLEGAAAAKDSGSPFLVRRENARNADAKEFQGVAGDSWILAGISAASETPQEDGRLGSYGTRNFACRVDTKRAWLREVLERGTDNSFPWEASREVKSESLWARTPAEHHLDRWIQAINSGEEASVRELVQNSYRMSGDDAQLKVAQLMDLSREIAPLRLRVVRSAGPTHASGLVWVEEHQFWGSVTACADQSEPGRLQEVVLRNAPAP